MHERQHVPEWYSKRMAPKALGDGALPLTFAGSSAAVLMFVSM